MQINWFIVTAQIVNFLILVFLLKRFLYGPITAAMQERQSRIERQENKAQDKLRSAEAREKEYLEKNERLAEEKEWILYNARRTAEEESKEYLEKAREEVRIQKNEWTEALEYEKKLYFQDFKRQIGLQSCQLARHLMHDLANVELEKQFIAVFLEKLQDLTDTDRTLMDQGFERLSKRAYLNSAFVIAEDDRSKLEKALHAKFTNLEKVDFKIIPELECGIQFEANGYHLDWSMQAYINRVEESLLLSKR